MHTGSSMGAVAVTARPRRISFHFLEELDRQGNDDFHEDLQEAMELPICEAAWTTLFDLERMANSKIKSIEEGGESMIHGNTGKKNVGNEREKAYLKIMEILQDLQDNHATPFATRIVCNVAGHSSLRDDNEFTYLSSTHFLEAPTLLEAYLI